MLTISITTIFIKVRKVCVYLHLSIFDTTDLL